MGDGSKTLTEVIVKLIREDFQVMSYHSSTVLINEGKNKKREKIVI